jgi:hypothetical protein
VQLTRVRFEIECVAKLGIVFQRGPFGSFAVRRSASKAVGIDALAPMFAADLNGSKKSCIDIGCSSIITP